MMKIKSPAKINLFLQVTGKRKDGYHNLVSLMCCIGLYDTITIEIRAPKTVISCTDPKIPVDETNLAYRAAQRFYAQFRYHQKKRGDHVAIHIDKCIPVAAGLGGGSSNAAAVLLGLNEYYGYPFSKSELLSMGQPIGADVPFFIYGSPAIASGIGERLETYYGLQPYRVLLVHPGFEVSTAKVYENLDLRLTNCKKKLKKVVFNKTAFNASVHLCNDLESVTEQRYPEIAVMKKSLVRQGAIGALMSGSGPAVFGLYSDAYQAQNACEALNRQPNWRIFLTDIILGAQGTAA